MSAATPDPISGGVTLLHPPIVPALMQLGLQDGMRLERIGEEVEIRTTQNGTTHRLRWPVTVVESALAAALSGDLGDSLFEPPQAA